MKIFIFEIKPKNDHTKSRITKILAHDIESAINQLTEDERRRIIDFNII